jgi:hypothetical protein
VKKLYVIICILTILTINPDRLYAWDGYDYDTGNDIEIEILNSVLVGKDITIYDFDAESYHDVNVISVATTILEVFDYDTGEYRTFVMEPDLLKSIK